MLSHVFTLFTCFPMLFPCFPMFSMFSQVTTNSWTLFVPGQTSFVESCLRAADSARVSSGGRKYSSFLQQALLEAPLPHNLLQAPLPQNLLQQALPHNLSSSLGWTKDGGSRGKPQIRKLSSATSCLSRAREARLSQAGKSGAALHRETLPPGFALNPHWWLFEMQNY